MTLYKLVQTLPARHISADVISLTDEGNLGSWIREAGATVEALGMKRGLPDLRVIPRLARALRDRRPNVVQTWMYHADLIGGLAARLLGSAPVAWGIRQSTLDPVHSKRLTRLTARICARLSRHLPDRIVCCSEEAARVHREMGYAAAKMRVIPNGFDLERYRPDPSAGAALRVELGIEPRQPVVGMVARYDPQKDHRTFIEAAAILQRRQPTVKFALVGEGVTWDNRELVGRLEAATVIDAFLLLGRRDDVARLSNVFDVASLSSAFGEGFPNAIGEAMACEVPCVVTDVGDSALLVGDTGHVVPVRDPIALADAWEHLITCEPIERQARGMAARMRVKRHFDISNVVEQYAALYNEMASARRAA